jgi:hypothetical protein
MALLLAKTVAMQENEGLTFARPGFFETASPFFLTSITSVKLSGSQLKLVVFTINYYNAC